MVKYGITDVFYKQANGGYTIFQGNYGKDLYVEDITSDGIQKIVIVKDKIGKENCEMFANVQVRAASWAIKTVKKNGNVVRRILYTKCEPNEIEFAYKL